MATIPVSEDTAGTLRNLFTDQVTGTDYAAGKVLLGANGTAPNPQGGVATPETAGYSAFVQERSQGFEFSYNPTISTSAYVDGYEVGTVQTVTSSVRTGAGVQIETISVADKDSQNAGLTFLFFRATVASGGTDHAAFNPNDTDALLFCGGVAITPGDYISLGSNSLAAVVNVGLYVRSVAANSLFMAIVVNGAPTYPTSAPLGFRIAGRLL